jgi:hypothetical protein
MLVFFCSHWNERVNFPDYETHDQMTDRLTMHVAKCPQATFSFDADTDEGERKMSGLRAAIEEARKARKK